MLSKTRVVSSTKFLFYDAYQRHNFPLIWQIWPSMCGDLLWNGAGPPPLFFWTDVWISTSERWQPPPRLHRPPSDLSGAMDRVSPVIWSLTPAISQFQWICMPWTYKSQNFFFLFSTYPFVWMDPLPPLGTFFWQDPSDHFNFPFSSYSFHR